MSPNDQKAAAWPWQPTIDVDYRVVKERRFFRNLALVAAVIGGGELVFRALDATVPGAGGYGAWLWAPPLLLDLALLIAGGAGLYFLRGLAKD